LITILHNTLPQNTKDNHTMPPVPCATPSSSSSSLSSYDGSVDAETNTHNHNNRISSDGRHTHRHPASSVLMSLPLPPHLVTTGSGRGGTLFTRMSVHDVVEMAIQISTTDSAVLPFLSVDEMYRQHNDNKSNHSRLMNPSQPPPPSQ
jgi:hypothetical protein